MAVALQAGENRKVQREKGKVLYLGQIPLPTLKSRVTWSPVSAWIGKAWGLAPATPGSGEAAEHRME